MRALQRLGLAMAALAMSAIIPVPSLAHHQGAIQPGAIFYGPAGTDRCTLNFVFRDHATERLFIGAAAHCVNDEGARVSAPGIGAFGTVVYRNHHSDDVRTPGEDNDFALIANRRVAPKGTGGVQLDV